MLLRNVGVIVLFAVSFPDLISAESSPSIKPFFDLRYQFEDNIFQVPTSGGRKSDFATNIWTGVDVRGMVGVDTRFAARYEAAPRRFADFDEKNRHDHLLSVLLRRRLSRNVTLLAVGNMGLRFQPSDSINEYFKQDVRGQVKVRWNPLWSSKFGAELRNKYFPNNTESTYTSAMIEGKLRRNLGATSHVFGGYQLRAYNGAIDPRVLVSNLNRNMKGIRQTAGVGFESFAFGRVLMNLKYQFGIDRATRELQRREHFPNEPEQGGEFDHNDGDNDATDFNFLTNRLVGVLVWRLAENSNLSLSARHHLKSYRDWVVPIKDDKRRDNLTLIRLGYKLDLRENLSARVEYKTENNDSNDPTQKYTDNMYSVQLQFGL